VKALHERNHHVVFFERNQTWYALNRDLPRPDYCEVRLFDDWASILPAVRFELNDCDVALVGSYFPDGVRAIEEVLESSAPVKAFYDIDTPITVANLRSGGADYITTEQVAGFDLYFSFTGGPLLRKLESEFGARRAVPLYCSFDPQEYFPCGVSSRYQCDLSYMGTYAADRQPKLDRLFIEPASALPGMNFLLAGSQYRSEIEWPQNVRHIHHLSPKWHPDLYSSSRLTLNLTREEMVAAGFSPSVRLFEAAACGAAIVSDRWPGLETFFRIGEEILVADNSQQLISLLKIDDSYLRTIGQQARDRCLREHSASQRAEEFERYVVAAASHCRQLPATEQSPDAHPRSLDSETVAQSLT
jgi:spore maturation protein CgeB